jgi:hypothetical protein
MPEEIQGVMLKNLLGGVLQAVMEAKRLGDLESAKLFDVYKSEKSLSSFSVPAFSISDMDLDLRFAVVETTEEQGEGEAMDIKVNVSQEALRELEDFQISRIKFRISPVSLRVFEESG